MSVQTSQQSNQATDQAVQVTVTNATSTQTTWLERLKQKLTSRKFLMALAGTIIGTAGIIGFQENVVATIVFGVIDVASILGYMITEGKIDAASVQTVVDVVGHIQDAIEGGLAGAQSGTFPGQSGTQYSNTSSQDGTTEINGDTESKTEEAE